MALEAFQRHLGLPELLLRYAINAFRNLATIHHQSRRQPATETTANHLVNTSTSTSPQIVFGQFQHPAGGASWRDDLEQRHVARRELSVPVTEAFQDESDTPVQNPRIRTNFERRVEEGGVDRGARCTRRWRGPPPDSRVLLGDTRRRFRDAGENSVSWATPAAVIATMSHSPKRRLARPRPVTPSAQLSGRSAYRQRGSGPPSSGARAAFPQPSGEAVHDDAGTSKTLCR